MPPHDTDQFGVLIGDLVKRGVGLLQRWIAALALLSGCDLRVGTGNRRACNVQRLGPVGGISTTRAIGFLRRGEPLFQQTGERVARALDPGFEVRSCLGYRSVQGLDPFHRGALEKVAARHLVDQRLERADLLLPQLIGQLGAILRVALFDLDDVEAIGAGELRAQERQMDRLYRQQQAYVGAVQDIQAIVTQTFYEGPQSLAALPERLFDSFKQLSADDIARQLFGGLFEELEDVATGVTPVQRAAGRMGEAIDRASASILDLGAAADRAIGALNGEAPPITVTARRQGAATPLTSEALFGRAIGGLATGGMRALGIGGNDLQIRDLGARIGDTAGKSLGGAFKGQAASGFASKSTG